ncbi:MAG: hypothetical protein QNK23_16815 [Crocinitomicaceae bacterium]|nr:hypothetical protein [Crocinitomicaceae bacterium]
MKSKALTYGLLIVVALIWYQVFFRVKDGLLGDPQIGENDQLSGPQFSDFSITRDTFDLKVDYRDPFGETEVKSQPTLQNPNVQAPEVRRPPKPQFVWPPITYLGRVRKTGSRNPLAIVNIDGIQLMVRRGDELYNDIIVKAIGRDSLVVVFKKNKKVLWRTD